jgi:S-adenosylmethionine-diacylglycerol 3-amino-3-carboxypropyl transferase
VLERHKFDDAVNDRLYYAQVREDPLLELTALRGCLDGTVAVVSSGGCTVLSLVVNGANRVIGVDRNCAQNHLVEFKAAAIVALTTSEAVAVLGGASQPAAQRLRIYAHIRDELTPGARSYWDARPELVAGGVINAGATERLYRVVSRAVRTLVHRPATINRLLSLQTIEEQKKFYEAEWNTVRWRLLFKLLCNRFVLNKTAVPTFFDYSENPNFSDHFLRIAERTLTTLPVGDNYFLHHILTGRYPETAPPPYLATSIASVVDKLTLVDAAFTEYLRTCPDGSLAGFSLSNICEWLRPEEVDALFAEIVRSARPGARVVFRNFIGWTEVPERWRETVREDRQLGKDLLRLDRSLSNRRFAVCTVEAST